MPIRALTKTSTLIQVTLLVAVILILYKQSQNIYNVIAKPDSETYCVYTNIRTIYQAQQY